MKTQRGGAWVRPCRRWSIYLRDGLTCLYCQRGLAELLDDDMFLTLDHIHADGGDIAWNLATACFECNRLKGVKSLAAFARDLDVPAGSIRRRLSIRRNKDLDRYHEAAYILLGAVAGIPRAQIVVANDNIAQYQFRADDPEYEYLRDQEPDHCTSCGRSYDEAAAVF